MSESSNESAEPSCDTFRSNELSVNTHRLTLEEQAIHAETERSKLNLENLKREVNQFLGLLQTRLESSTSSSEEEQTRNLSIIYSATEPDSRFPSQAPEEAQSELEDDFQTPKVAGEGKGKGRGQSQRQSQGQSAGYKSDNKQSEQSVANSTPNTFTTDCKPMGIESALSCLKKYCDMPGVELASKQLLLEFDSLLSENIALRRKNAEMLQAGQRLKEQNELHKEAIETIQTQWQMLVKNNEALVGENFALVERLEQAMGGRSRQEQLAKEVEYYRYLILTANEKYEAVKQQSSQKSLIIKSLVSKEQLRESGFERNDRLRELLCKIRASKESGELDSLVTQFVEEESMQTTQVLSQPLAPQAQAQSESGTRREERSSKKGTAPRRRAKEDFSVEESYRKMLFK